MRDTRDAIIIIAAITLAVVVLMFAATASDLWKQRRIKNETEQDVRRLLKEVKETWFEG